MSGQAKCGVKGSNGVVTGVALFGIVVFIFANLAKVVEAVLWTAGCLVVACVGFTIGYVWMLVARSRRDRALLWTATNHLPPAQARQPVAQPQRQALPQGTVVHNHYGHTLSLPGLTDGAEAAKVFRDGQ